MCHLSLHACQHGWRYTGPMRPLVVALLLLFGRPETSLVARARGGIERVCPCRGDVVTCDARHELAASVIGHVAAEDEDPGEALALLIGTGCHETRFSTEMQVGGGPARSWWQLEPTAPTRTGREAQAAAWLDDPVLAARVALSRARTCGGSLRGYAWGKCGQGSAEQERVAAELRRYVGAARLATR